MSKRKRDSGETRERALKMWGKYPANKAMRTRKEREEMEAEKNDEDEKEEEKEQQGGEVSEGRGKQEVEEEEREEDEEQENDEEEEEAANDETVDVEDDGLTDRDASWEAEGMSYLFVS